MRKVLYIFGELADTDIDWLIEHGSRLSVAEGEVLIREHVDIDSMYIVLDGELVVHANVTADQQIVHLGAGEIVGEMSLVDERPPSATVQAAKDSTLFAVPRDLLLVKLSVDTDFAARFYRAIALFLSTRLRGTVTRFGYGDTKLDRDVMQDDELDPRLLENINLAEKRFSRLLQQL